MAMRPEEGRRGEATPPVQPSARGQEVGPGRELRQDVDRAADEARRVGERAEDTANEVLARRKRELAGDLDDVAQAVGRTAHHLRSEGQGSIASYVDRAGQKLGQVSQSLRDRELRDLASQLEDVARREPMLFFGGAMALGFALSRLFKSRPRAGEDLR